MHSIIMSLFLLIVAVNSVMAAVNLALNKPADQTGAYDGLYAYKAVDGRYGANVSNDNCAHPDNKNIVNGAYSPAEWWVDLQDTYRVNNVTIYNTYDIVGSNRLEYFVISVGSTKDDRTDCGGTYTQRVSPGGSVTISCDLTGRFVHFRRVGGFQPKYVTLCEVEVYGRTEIDCSKCPGSSACSPITGCSQCDAGKLPPDCVSDCADGMYGLNCSSPCGRCRYTSVCDKSDGACPSADGCQLWYTGDRCDVEGVVPNWTDETITPGTTTTSTITVTWQQIRNLPTVPDDYYMYLLDYRTGSGYYRKGPDVSHDPSSASNTATVTDLVYNTDYVIRASPYRTMRSEIKYGRSYETINVKTKCNAPDVPGVALEVLDGGMAVQKIKVSYQQTYSGCNSLSTIWIEYRGSGSRDWISETGDVNDRSYTLLPSGGGTYEIRVTVKNDGGITTSSNVQTVTINGPPTTTTTTTTTTATPSTRTTVSEPSRGSYKCDCDIPWAIVGASIAIIIGMAIALVIMVTYYKRKFRKLKSRGDQYLAVQDHHPGFNVHLDQIGREPEKSKTVHRRNQPTSSQGPSQDQDKAEYEEVGIAMVSPPSDRVQDDGTGQYYGLRGGIYENSQTTGPYETITT